MKTIKTFNPAADQTDAILGIFNTPEYHARVKEAQQKQASRYWKIRLTIDALLVAFGFALGLALSLI